MPDLVIPPLSGGLADRISDALKKDNELIQCQNLDLDNATVGAVTPMIGKGEPYPTLTLKDGNGNNILGYKMREIIRTKSSGELFQAYKYVLFGDGYAHGVRYEQDDPGDAFPFITDNIPNNITDIVEDNRKLYICSKNDKPKVFQWDGVPDDVDNPVVRDMGLKYELSNVNITFSSSAGDIPIGRYKWVFIPTDESGALFPADTINPIYAGWDTTSSNIVFGGLDTIKSGLEANYNLGENLYVYRSKEANSINDQNAMTVADKLLRLVDVLKWDDLADAGYTWTDDNDPTPSTYLDQVDGTPPEDLIHIILWNNRMFGFCKDSPILRFSEEWQYEIWSVYNQIVIGGSDPIRAIVQRGENLVIFKDSEVYEFYGTGIHNYDYRRVSNVHGTNRPKTVQAIDKDRIIFVDLQGRVWLYDGGFSEISLPINIRGNYFKSAVMGRYYMLWSKNLLGIQGYDPVIYDNEPDDPVDDPFWDAPSPDPHANIGDIGGADDEEGSDEDNNDPSEDDYYEDGAGNRWRVGEEYYSHCYGFHIQTGRWTELTGMEMNTVEQPSRGGEGTLLLYDGTNLVLIGDDRFSNLREPLVLQSKFFYSTDNQEKSFRDVDIEIFNKGTRLLDDTLVGELEFYVNGDIESRVEKIDLIFDAGRTGQQRVFYRFPIPIRGKSISVRFVGNDNTRYFEIRDIKMYLRPVGSPIRA